MAGDDPDEMDTAHISYAQIKRQAMTLGVTITGLGIRDALLNGLLVRDKLSDCYRFAKHFAENPGVQDRPLLLRRYGP